MDQQGARRNKYLQAIDTGSEDRYLDLRRLSQYSCLSVRTLRSHLRLPVDPLPAYFVGGKLFVRRSEFDAWMSRHRYKNAAPDASTFFDEVMAEFKELL